MVVAQLVARNVPPFSALSIGSEVLGALPKRSPPDRVVAQARSVESKEETSDAAQ
jgi:hypothetical protein